MRRNEPIGSSLSCYVDGRDMEPIISHNLSLIYVSWGAYPTFEDIIVSNSAKSANERGGLIDVPKAENTHLRRENVSGVRRGVV